MSRKDVLTSGNIYPITYDVLKSQDIFVSIHKENILSKGKDAF